MCFYYSKLILVYSFLVILIFCFLARYIIPVPVIRHFVNGVEESGKYTGFCSLGISCQPMENVQLREEFQMQPEMTGVLISKINPLSDAYCTLRKDDIILSFDGVPIANDGTGRLFFLFILLFIRLSLFIQLTLCCCYCSSFPE